MSLVGLPGCSDGETIPLESLSSMVLQANDLPRTFTQFDAGKQVQADFLPGPRSDPERFGRRGGWKCRFRRSGDAQTSGPLVVESRVDVFASADGAADDLEAYRDQYRATVRESRGAGRMLADPAVGDESVAMTLRQPGTPGIELYSVAWRQRNATASVTATGIARRLNYTAVKALVRAQARRVVPP
jgi:hypothetical protein